MNVHLEDVNRTHLNFSWDPVFPSCPPLQYDIHATNCGVCSSRTNVSFLCENVEITTNTKMHMCSVAVQPRCGDVVGMMSQIFQVTLKGDSELAILSFVPWL